MTSVGAPPVAAASQRPVALGVALWAIAAAAMAVLALANPINTDEGQYVAPAAVAQGAMPFVDYLYLQTPLQADLSGPFAWLVPGYGFIAMRIVTALIGVAILAIVYAAQRALGVTRKDAAICTALLGGCYSFQFGCGVVRNDALPALLATAGLAVALAALRRTRWIGVLWALAGLLFGLAASAKISYAVPAAGAGLFLIVELVRKRQTFSTLAGYGLGGLVGTAPSILAWLQAPQTFVFGVFTYAAVAPLPWQRAQHNSWIVNPAANVLITTGVLLVGPALGALLRVATRAAGRGWADEAKAPSCLLLDISILAGLIAAILPTPTNFQYALPALPALFIRLGLEAAKPPSAHRRLERLTGAMIVFGMVCGVGYHLVFLAQEGLARGFWQSAAVTRQAHWIGDELRRRKTAGLIGSLAPELVLDSGYRLDPRFATGAIVYRSADLFPAGELTRLKAIGPQNLAQSLDANPPAALVIGGAPPFEAALRQYAAQRGYLRARSPYGGVDLEIRPY
ncbi:MAG: hypothetical protein ACHP7N_12925 [Caulobacterales bacterium]